MVFYYDVLGRFGDAHQRIRSVTNPRRGAGQFTVCSTLTSLTSAMCARYFLEGEVGHAAVLQPTDRRLYTRVLTEYEAMGIRESQTREAADGSSLR